MVILLRQSLWFGALHPPPLIPPHKGEGDATERSREPTASWHRFQMASKTPS